MARWEWREFKSAYFEGFSFKHPLGEVWIFCRIGDPKWRMRLYSEKCDAEILLSLIFPSADFAKLAAENLFAFDRRDYA